MQHHNRIASIHDKKTEYLLSNGDIPAWTNQEIYEYAWNLGIRPLRESNLKPDLLVRKRRRGPSEPTRTSLNEITGGLYVD
jgi:hypothetical protein